MIFSRITSKAQTTVPLAVRRALRVAPGDKLLYQVEGDRVIITKAPTAEAVPEDPFAAFDEWDSDADRKAYADL